jgi:hypothetical protein
MEARDTIFIAASLGCIFYEEWIKASTDLKEFCRNIGKLNDKAVFHSDDCPKLDRLSRNLVLTQARFSQHQDSFGRIFGEDYLREFKEQAVRNGFM